MTSVLMLRPNERSKIASSWAAMRLRELTRRGQITSASW
jgi:hypothetical protein